MTPFFSIIMPTYNRISFLNTSIQSVLDQTFEDWELIIVDDGSTDGTAELIAGFRDKRIKYHYQKNKGRSAARNLGIALAEGKYIAFLDSDDEYKSDHLKTHKDYIDIHDGPVALFYSLGSFREKGIVNKDSNPLYLNDLSFEICPMTLSISVHRDILEENEFEPSLMVREDAELWDRIRRKYSFIRIEKYTVVANYHEGNSRQDLFKYYKNLEYAILFYIKDRFEFSSEEYHKLIEAYKKLAYLNYQKGNVSRSFVYLLKELILHPYSLGERSFWGLTRRNILSLFNN